MANLDVIKRLNEYHGKQSPVRTETKLFAINEAIGSDRIEKAITNSLASVV
jgi:hypothetical protein